MRYWTIFFEASQKGRLLVNEEMTKYTGKKKGLTRK